MRKIVGFVFLLLFGLTVNSCSNLQNDITEADESLLQPVEREDFVMQPGRYLCNFLTSGTSCLCGLETQCTYTVEGQVEYIITGTNKSDAVSQISKMRKITWFFPDELYEPVKQANCSEEPCDLSWKYDDSKNAIYIIEPESVLNERDGEGTYEWFLDEVIYTPINLEVYESPDGKNIKTRETKSTSDSSCEIITTFVYSGDSDL